MPKEAPKITTRLDDSDFGQYPTVIDITMGEFAFSDFYPIHSDSYATCMGVVMGAVEGYGVCLAHLDPLADQGGLYKASLDAMIDAMLGTRTRTVDVVFFKDGFQALAKYDLQNYLSGLRHADRVRHVVDLTDVNGPRYDEVVAMPSSFYSAYICLKPAREQWDCATGKRVLRAQTTLSGNQTAMSLGRARRVAFQYTAGWLGRPGTESVLGETP